MAILSARGAARSVAVACALAGTVSACYDEVTPPQRAGVAAETNAIRLYLDNEPVMTIYEDGKVTLGPIVFLRTATNVATERPIRAELLDRDGNVISNTGLDDVRINIGTEPDNNANRATASFIRTDALSGRIRSTTTTLPATTSLLVGLYDMNQRRVAIGPYTVRITARLP